MNFLPVLSNLTVSQNLGFLWPTLQTPQSFIFLYKHNYEESFLRWFFCNLVHFCSSTECISPLLKSHWCLCCRPVVENCADTHRDHTHTHPQEVFLLVSAQFTSYQANVCKIPCPFPFLSELHNHYLCSSIICENFNQPITSLEPPDSWTFHGFWTRTKTVCLLQSSVVTAGINSWPLRKIIPATLGWGFRQNPRSSVQPGPKPLFLRFLLHDPVRLHVPPSCPVTHRHKGLSTDDVRAFHCI